MEDGKIYTWTFSAIVMLDRGEEYENVFCQWEAYKEFENSIISIANPSKNIIFFIYLYDKKDRYVYIKESSIIDGKYCLDIIEHYPLAEFYTDCRKHISAFFRKHVSKKFVDENELHRNFLITWGHASGFGFFSTVHDNTQESELPRKVRVKLENYKSEIGQFKQHLQKIRFLKAQLSLTEGHIDINNLVDANDFFANTDTNFTTSDKIALKSYAGFSIKCLTANDLKEAIEDGFKDDACFFKAKNDGSIPKIDYLMCVSCFTQMIETGDILKDVIKIMIAPLTTISFYGYNYEALFKLISESPEACEKKIADNLVNNYLAKYSANNIYKSVQNNGIFNVEYAWLTSFNVVYLERYTAIKQGIRKFFDFVLQNGDIILFNFSKVSAIDGLRFARRRCSEISFNSGLRGNTGIIEFNNLLMKFYELYGAGDFTTVTPLADDFNTITSTYSNQTGLGGEPFILSQYCPAHYNYHYYSNQGEILTLSAGYFGLFLPLGLDAREVVTRRILKKEKINITLWDEINWRKLVEQLNM